MNSNKNLYAKLIPVMLCFFAMGFVDLVGIASNYVKADLDLTDSQANIFPSLVFFWFLIFSVPTGILMNKIGRKKTVLLSLIVTFASLLLPIFGDGYTLMLISFSLLGIGNALMQTSLNPLLSNIIAGEKLASTLTFGQFVKAIASFLAKIYNTTFRTVHYHTSLRSVQINLHLLTQTVQQFKTSLFTSRHQLQPLKFKSTHSLNEPATQA
jgi:fucose permease